MSVGLNMAKLHKLSALEVKRAKTGPLYDGGGLMLRVQTPSAKSWLLRYQLKGVRRDMGLGSFPTTGLEDARTLAAEARKLISQKIDPLDAKWASEKAAKPLPTFGAVAALVIADAQAKTESEKVKYQWARHLGPGSLRCAPRPGGARDHGSGSGARAGSGLALQARGRAQALSGNPACVRSRPRHPPRRAWHRMFDSC